jgi:hypothetical protein
MKVFGRVLVGRAVTTADVTAGETQAEMNPPGAGLEAFLASVGRARLDRSKLRDVGASGWHYSSSDEGAGDRRLRRTRRP